MLAYHTTTSPPLAADSAVPPDPDAARLMLFALKRLDSAFEAAAERGSQLPSPTELKRIRSVAQMAIAAAERSNGERV